MARRYQTGFGYTLLLVAAMGMTEVAAADPDTALINLDLAPAQQSVEVGEEVRVELWISPRPGESARYIAGASVILAWDPAILKLTWARHPAMVFDENYDPTQPDLLGTYDFVLAEFMPDDMLDRLNNDLDPALLDPFTTYIECTPENGAAVCGAYGSHCEVRECHRDYECQHGGQTGGHPPRLLNWCNEASVCDEVPMPSSPCSEGNPTGFDTCCSEEGENCCALQGWQTFHDATTTEYYQEQFDCYTCRCAYDYCAYTKLPFNDGEAEVTLLSQVGAHPETGQWRALRVPLQGHYAGAFAFEAIAPGVATVEMLRGGPEVYTWGSETGVYGLEYPYTGLNILNTADSTSVITVSPHPGTGACCLNGTCIIASGQACENANGVYRADGTACQNLACPAPDLADLDNDGDVDLNDFKLLQLRFTGPQF